VGIRTISGLSIASSDSLKGSIIPSPAPHASKTAQGEGVPALSGSDVKSDTVEEVLLSRRGPSDADDSTTSWSSSGRGRLDLNRRKSTVAAVLLLAETSDAAADDDGRIDDDDDVDVCGHLLRTAAVLAAR
jgi:hypothetical protein